MTTEGDVAHAGQDLRDLTVIDVSGGPAASFAGSLLADFGAVVVVVEPPGGAPLRRLGPSAVQDVWWKIAARNKRSLALDIARADAAGVTTRLLERADIVLRDGDTPAAWADWVRNAPNVLDVHLHAPGADRPDLWSGSTDPRLAAAATGAMALTGEKDGPPCQAEFPLADYCAALQAATSALIELRNAHREKRPPRAISIGTHEALLRMNEWQVVFASARGFAEQRNGNRFPMNANIGNIFRTRDDKLVTLSAATLPVAARLLHLIGGEALRDDPRFSTVAARRKNMDELELLVAAWIEQHDMADVLRMGREADVVIGPIMDAADLMADPQVQARENVIRVPTDDGALAMPGIVPRISGMAAQVRHVGPAVGADNDPVLARLGFTAGDIAALRHAKAIWT